MPSFERLTETESCFGHGRRIYLRTGGHHTREVPAEVRLNGLTLDGCAQKCTETEEVSDFGERIPAILRPSKNFNQTIICLFSNRFCL